MTYYRRMIPDFAATAKPLTMLTGSNATFTWDEPQQEAFDNLRQRVITAPVLHYPDHNSQYILDTDESSHLLGGVLSQIQDGEEKVIAYWSNTLSPAKMSYCTTSRELLLIIGALKHFCCYLYGLQFGYAPTMQR